MMHPCYALHVFMCCCQPALFVLNVSLNRHLTYYVMHWVQRTNETDNSSSGSEPLFVEQWSTHKLDTWVAICSCLASYCGIMYLLLQRADKELSFFYHADDESATTILEAGASSSGVQALEGTRLAFWLFAFVQAYVVSLKMTESVQDMEHMLIQIVCRDIGLWVLCRTGRSIRGRTPIALGVCVYIYWAGGMGMTAHNAQGGAWLAYQIILDLLLFLGHRWDAQVSVEMVLNCRLFYIAFASSGVLLLTAVSRS